MPIARVQLPDGRIGKFEVPEGTTPEQIESFVASQMGTKKPEAVKQDISGPEQFLIGLGAGFTDFGKGVQQLGAVTGEKLGLVSPETVQRITAEGQESRDALKPLLTKDTSVQHGSEQEVMGIASQGDRETASRFTPAGIGNFVGKVLPYSTMPGGVAGGALKRAGTSAIAGGAMGLAEFVPEGGSRAVNTAVGATLGAGTSAALSGAGKVFNGFTTDPLEKSLINQQSKQFNIPTTLSEVTGGSSKIDSIMETMPWKFGTSKFRAQQQEAAKTAATKQFSQYVVDPSLDSTAAMKEANKAHIDTLYEKVRTSAAAVPKGSAPETKQVAAELLERYPAVFETLQDNKMKRIITDIVGDTQTKTKTIDVFDEFGNPRTTPGIGGGHGGSKPVPVSLLDATGKPIRQKVEPQFSFDDLWELRKGVGQAIGGAKTPTESAQLNALLSSVSNDMENMVRGKGGAYGDLVAANDAFKQYSVKFDAMREAYDKAIGTVGSNTAGFFSPQRYGVELKRLANDPKYKKNIKWSDNEVSEMTGLANILQVTKRAGQFMENPPTGARWGIPTVGSALGGSAAIAGGAAAVATTVGTAVGAALITKFLTTTNRGKSLVLAASKVEPTSKAMQHIINQVYNQLPKFAEEAGNEINQ